MADLLKRLKISEQQYGVGMEDNPFQDVTNDEAMKVCFGGGGGGQPPPLLLKQSHNKQVTYLNIFNHILNDCLKEAKLLQQNRFKDTRDKD